MLNDDFHVCTDDVKWTSEFSQFNGHLDFGNSLERIGNCQTCNKVLREIYTYSCTMDDDADEIIEEAKSAYE